VPWAARSRSTSCAPGTRSPVTALTAQQLAALMGQGWGDDDTSSLLRVLEAQAGMTAAERRPDVEIADA
jgi:hypothetical protein